jgi:hypothetical protein
MRPADLNVTIYMKDGTQFGETVSKEEWEALNIKEHYHFPFIKVGDTLFSIGCVQAISVE